LNIMIDCSNCKNIYWHQVLWSEYWCSKLNKEIYNLHELNRRFRDECGYFKDKNIPLECESCLCYLCNKKNQCNMCIYCLNIEYHPMYDCKEGEILI